MQQRSGRENNDEIKAPPTLSVQCVLVCANQNRLDAKIVPGAVQARNNVQTSSRANEFLWQLVIYSRMFCQSRTYNKYKNFFFLCNPPTKNILFQRPLDFGKGWKHTSSTGFKHPKIFKRNTILRLKIWQIQSHLNSGEPFYVTAIAKKIYILIVIWLVNHWLEACQVKCRISTSSQHSNSDCFPSLGTLFFSLYRPVVSLGDP